MKDKQDVQLISASLLKLPGGMKGRPRRTLVLAVAVFGSVFIPRVQADMLDTPMPAVAGNYQLSDEHAPGDIYMGIRLLGSVRLAPVEPQGLPMVELSALAFDADENILYALSDRGRIYHLRPGFENNLLKNILVLAVYRLRDANGKPLKGRKADSEGMVALHARNAAVGDTELVISFERTHRIVRYSPQGRLLGKLELPSRLADKARYRSPNRGIEAITLDPRFGLLAAPEKPFKDSPADVVEIIALDTPGLFWRYRLAAEPHAALVSMEMLNDGSILTLERAHGEFYVPFITSIRRIRTLASGSEMIAQVETVARLSTGQGWNLDNFEGLARHTKNFFFMVSDDNGMIYQSTVLSYFEVLEHEPHQRSQPVSSIESPQRAP